MDFWETWTFADLLAEPVRNGIYKKKEFHGRGQKMINMGELFSYDFISNQEMRRIELNDRELANYLVKDGDLLFARRSFVLEGSGKCSLVVQPSENTTFESSIIRARPNPDWTDPHFYYYLFRSPQGRALISSIATRTAVSGIRGSELALLKVPKPPLPIQRKIAAVLSTYDDLIENNTRRIEILEEMAQAIYREWFVEFRFPGHGQVEMVESELGLIPQGWEVGELGDAIENIKEKVKPGKHLEPLPYVPIDCIPRHSIGLIEHKPSSEAKSSLIAFKRNDILFGAMRSYFHKVIFAPFDGITRQTCFVLRSRNPDNYSFDLFTMFQDSTVEYSSNYSTGSTIPYATWDGALAIMPIVRPPYLLMKQFSDIVAPMLDSMRVLTIKNTNLRQTRDLLLPKLISGEIDVSELDIDTD